MRISLKVKHNHSKENFPISGSTETARKTPCFTALVTCLLIYMDNADGLDELNNVKETRPCLICVAKTKMTSLFLFYFNIFRCY